MTPPSSEPTVYAVVSVDTSVDGVHFRWGQLSPDEIGHRALASALSDLAAMGARPGQAYLALGLPAGIELQAALGIVSGAQGVASSCTDHDRRRRRDHLRHADDLGDRGRLGLRPR